MCVVDSHNHRLQIFSQESGGAPRVIGSEGREAGEFAYPSGVACDGTSLFVGDTCNRRVQKLSLDGAHLAQTVDAIKGGAFCVSMRNRTHAAARTPE